MNRPDGPGTRLDRDERLSAAVPVGYMVVGFPPGESALPSRVTAELARLQREQIIRVLDLVLVQKAFDGSVAVFEVGDELEQAVPIERDADGAVASALVALGPMEPGSVAGVVVWENVWALALAGRVAEGGSQVLAAGFVERPGSHRGVRARP